MTRQQELIPIAAGGFLKQQRKALKLSLAAVARTINLDETILRAIEDNEADHIAPVYRKGYIQTYANYLKIPQDEIRKLLAQTPAAEEPLHAIFSAPPKRSVVDKWLRASSYVLASLLIGTLAWQFTHEAVRLSQNGSRLHNGQQEVQSANTTSLPGQTLTGPVSASIASLDILNDTPAKSSDAAGQTLATVSRAPLPEGEGRLQVNVSADSWIEINDADGRELELDLLRGGSKKSYQGKLPFRILIGRASAVRLSVNGEAVDLTPFVSDDVARMTWPQQLPAQELRAAGEKPDEN